MKTYIHKCVGTCSREIEISYDEETHIIDSVIFRGGCDGNTKGVSILSKGQTLENLIKLLKNIDCRGRGTSCPDQLARSCEEILNLK